MAHNTSNTVVVDDGVPPEMDYREHQKTYNGFIAASKWSIIVMAVFLVALYFVVNP